MKLARLAHPARTLVRAASTASDRPLSSPFLEGTWPSDPVSHILHQEFGSSPHGPPSIPLMQSRSQLYKRTAEARKGFVDYEDDRVHSPGAQRISEGAGHEGVDDASDQRDAHHHDARAHRHAVPDRVHGHAHTNADELHFNPEDEDGNIDGIHAHKHAVDGVVHDKNGDLRSKKSSQEIIKLLMNRVHTESWTELGKDVEKYNIELTPEEVAWVLKMQKSASRAWSLFTWVSQQPNYAHDPSCFAIMIETLARDANYSLLESLLSEMERVRIPYTVSMINRLIGVYSCSEDIEKAEHYYVKLEKLGIKPNAYTYKCMLQAFAKAGKCEKAMEIYEVAQKRKQPLDIITYNMLLDGLSRNDQVEQVLNIFEKIRSRADVYTYTIVARTLGHTGDAMRAIQLLEEMVQKGVEPNRLTYNTILDAVVNQNRLDDGIRIFKSMLERDVHPDVSSCHAILKLLCKGHQVGRTLDLTRWVKDKTLKKEVYECFIQLLGKMGYLQEARALFNGMKIDGIRPNQLTCLSMISLLCRAAEPDEALVIVKERENSGHNLPINTYNSIMAAFRNNKRFEAAYDLFKEVKEKGPSLDVISYNIVIAGLAKAGKLELAHSLFDEMDKIGCIPNVITFNSLLHSFARLGDIDSTRKLLQQMKAKEISPDIVTYNCTIECFGKAGKPKVALNVFKEMIEKGCSPSFVTYNNLLLSMQKANMIDAALSLFEQMKEQGFVPDAMTFTVLSRIYESCPQLDKRKLVAEIRNAGLAYELKVSL